MAFRRLLALLTVVTLGVAACDVSTAPSGGQSATAGSPAAGDSREPGAEPTSPVVGQLTGAWRRSPIALDDGHVAIISDACAAEARKTLDDAAADLPTALVDAQGDNLAIAILADDLDAILCQVNLDRNGGVLSIESVAWLSKTATAAVQGKDLSLASVFHAPDGTRTVAFGRVGPEPSKVRAGFDDQTFVLAARDQGWWAMWWPGTVKAATFAAVDNRNIAVDSLPAPAGELEARLKNAEWWIDPAGPPPTAKSTRIHTMVSEEECASGRSLEGLVDPPLIDLGADMVTVTFRIRRPTGTFQTCPGNPPLRMILELPEPLGDRALLDGGSDPPRDASKPPD